MDMYNETPFIDKQAKMSFFQKQRTVWELVPVAGERT
jgi:hypothetical protein